MKNVSLLFFIAALFWASTNHAQSPRDSLMDRGQQVLESGAGGAAFREHVESLDRDQALSPVELSYLRDLHERLPLALRTEVCPPGDELVCGKTLPERASGSFFAAHPSKWEPPPPEPTSQGSASSWRNSWWLPVIAGGLLLSYGLRGKEIQVSAP